MPRICIKLLVLILIGCACCLAACSDISQPRDINTVNGCPEFQDITWEMTKAEIEPLLAWDAEGENYLIAEQAALPEGLPEVDVLLEFSGTEQTLSSVMFFFPKSVSEDFAATAEIYQQLYGAPSSGSIEEQQLSWLGSSTHIYMSKSAQNITVAYLRLADDIPLDQMDEADFLDYIDPFAFLGEPALLGYSIDELINSSGYVEGQNYQLFTTSDQTVYTFLPGIEYFGADISETYIEMYVPDGSELIEYFTYGFIYQESEVNELIALLEEALPRFQEIFGEYQACAFSALGSQTANEISWEEFCTSLAELQEGTYSLLWIAGELTATINITVDSGYQGLINSTLGFAAADYWQ